MKNKGFTLIEMLVVLGISALLFGFSFAAYTNFNRERIVKEAAEDIKMALTDAQHRAMSGEMDRRSGYCSAGSKLNNWSVRWGYDSNKKLYSLGTSCTIGGMDTDYENVEVYNLNDNVIFVNNGIIKFNSFLGNTPGGVVQIQGNSIDYFIRVCPGGQIRVNNADPGC